jgi:hypothetical protein
VAGRVPAGSREAQRGPLDSARKRAGRVLRVEPGSPGTSTANASQRPCARSQRWVGAEDRAVRLPERGRARPTRRPEIRVLPRAGPARSAARPSCQQRTSDRAARPSESRAGRRGQRRSAPRGRPRSDSRRTAGRNAAASQQQPQSSYLVDPASSHMLVSKIKPCMSKYTPQDGETANGSLNQLWFLRSYNPTWITVAILELIHATQLRPRGKSAFVSPKPIRSSRPAHLVTLNNFVPIACPSGGDVSFKCLPYQLSMVRAMPTMVITGNGESGFDSGEGA